MTIKQSIQWLKKENNKKSLKALNILLSFRNSNPENWIGRTSGENNKYIIELNLSFNKFGIKLLKLGYDKRFINYVNKYKWIFIFFHELGHVQRFRNGLYNEKIDNKQRKEFKKGKRKYGNIHEEYMANKFALNLCKKFFENKENI